MLKDTLSFPRQWTTKDGVWWKGSKEEGKGGRKRGRGAEDVASQAPVVPGGLGDAG